MTRGFVFALLVGVLLFAGCREEATRPRPDIGSSGAALPAEAGLDPHLIDYCIAEERIQDLQLGLVTGERDVQPRVAATTLERAQRVAIGAAEELEANGAVQAAAAVDAWAASLGGASRAAGRGADPFQAMQSSSLRLLAIHRLINCEVDLDEPPSG